jgi:hypothetical protein
MSQQHLCFFSTRCRFCQAFLEELSRSPYSKDFRFICVDRQPGKPPITLPPYVKAVPTLMIAGESEPRTDSQVMNWLSERRLREREGVASGGGFAAGAARVGAAPADGILAFTDDMFSSCGDEGFAFLDEVTSQKEGQMVRVASNMASVNDIHRMQVPDMGGPAPIGGGSGGGDSSSNAGGGRQTAKAKAMEDAFSAYQAARDRDLPKASGFAPAPTGGFKR